MENGLVNDSLGTIRDNVVWEEGKDLLLAPFFGDTGTHLIGLILDLATSIAS
jgi:hypothetical protein